jgi:hypothetical protein
MKRFFGVCLLAVLALFSCVSMGETLTEPLSYNEVVDIAGVSSSDLFTKANMWFVDAFKNADSVIQFSDRDSGTIKGKYVSDLVLSNVQQYLITTTITVEVKDEKYRILFTDPNYKQYATNVFGDRGGFFTDGGTVTTQVMADNIKNEWINLSKNLKESVQKNDSW